MAQPASPEQKALPDVVSWIACLCQTILSLVGFTGLNSRLSFLQGHQIQERHAHVSPVGRAGWSVFEVGGPAYSF